MERRRAAIVLALVAAPWAAGCGSPEPPRHERVRVPRLLDLRTTTAICRLDAAGLRWRVGGEPVERETKIPCGPVDGVTTRIFPDPPVRRQNPPPGKRVPAGSVVRFETLCTLLPPGQACL